MGQIDLPLPAMPAVVPTAPSSTTPAVRSIAEQCPELEWKVEELLGRTARELRVLGFEIPASIPSEYVLRLDVGIEVDVSTQGQRTGLAWVKR